MTTPRAAAREQRLLVRDARNRALRSFLQGLAIDLAVAVAVVLHAATSSGEPLVWGVVAASLLRTVVQTAAAFVMRRFLDPSRIPTPLPPNPPGEPDADPVLADAGHVDGLTLIAGIVVVALGIVLATLLLRAL